ncbi:hypothetical protein PBF_05373 [Cytobacillus firmus DS1]|uniref:Uncharacterized protein n=1 Tax=Cytobacillus firmus DS1 TaxID=1307436 RepID=W7L1G7_CYTFI|nr:hypothetical protein PBF_05373 [Cytobacillus firmus DS1]
MTPFLGAPSTRRALQEGVLSFRKGLACDLEGVGAGAKQLSKYKDLHSVRIETSKKEGAAN